MGQEAAGAHSTVQVGPELVMGLWEEEASTAMTLRGRGQPESLAWKQGQRSAPAQF